MDEQIWLYNTQITKLLDLIDAELPNNAMVDTIRRRFRAVLSVDRTHVIEETSPELLEYRDMIYEGRWDDLIYKNWEAVIDRKDEALMNEIDNNSLGEMVKLLRGLWENYNDDQREYIKRALRKMLSYSIKYYKAKANQ